MHLFCQHTPEKGSFSKNVENEPFSNVFRIAFLVFVRYAKEGGDTK